MMRHEGWEVNHKRVERIWNEEGLKVPQRQKKRRRLKQGLEEETQSEFEWRKPQIPLHDNIRGSEYYNN